MTTRKETEEIEKQFLTNISNSNLEDVYVIMPTSKDSKRLVSPFGIPNEKNLITFSHILKMNTENSRNDQNSITIFPNMEFSYLRSIFMEISLPRISLLDRDALRDFEIRWAPDFIFKFLGKVKIFLNNVELTIDPTTRKLLYECFFQNRDDYKDDYCLHKKYNEWGKSTPYISPRRIVDMLSFNIDSLASMPLYRLQNFKIEYVFNRDISDLICIRRRVDQKWVELKSDSIRKLVHSSQETPIFDFYRFNPVTFYASYVNLTKTEETYHLCNGGEYLYINHLRQVGEISLHSEIQSRGGTNTELSNDSRGFLWTVEDEDRKRVNHSNIVYPTPIETTKCVLNKGIELFNLPSTMTTHHSHKGDFYFNSSRNRGVHCYLFGDVKPCRKLDVSFYFSRRSNSIDEILKIDFDAIDNNENEDHRNYHVRIFSIEVHEIELKKISSSPESSNSHQVGSNGV